METAATAVWHSGVKSTFPEAVPAVETADGVATLF